MGYKNRREVGTDTCLSEALLFATMCIIGFPVDVHVRDGSIFSGIFHTASVDKEYGIVLKEAKLTKKGKLVGNVANGSVIETLVIHSSDLVQVVAKGVLFPADGGNGNVVSDSAEAVVKVPSSGILQSKATESNKPAVDKIKINDNRISARNTVTSANGFMPTKAEDEHDGRKVSSDQTLIATEVELGKKDVINTSKGEESPDASVFCRQVGDERSQGEHSHQKQKDDHVQNSNSIRGFCNSEAKAVVEGQATMKSSPHEVSCGNVVCSSTSMAPVALAEVTSEARSGSLSSLADVSPQSSESSKSSKEFKLNPGAKIFCPSFATPKAANAVLPAVSTIAYVPSNSPVLPAVVAPAQPEVGINYFAPRASVPAKFAPYANLPAVNGGNGPQFSQPIVSHVANRTPPLRYTGHYHGVQVGPAYMPPNSQAVMVGQLGQLVYVQPVHHELVHSAAANSPVPPRPLLTPHQVQYPKHQGTAAGHGAMQICAPPPFIAGGQQPLPIPNHVSLLQHPISANRPIPVPGSNAFFSTKFP